MPPILAGLAFCAVLVVPIALLGKRLQLKLASGWQPELMSVARDDRLVDMDARSSAMLVIGSLTAVTAALAAPACDSNESQQPTTSTSSGTGAGGSGGATTTTTTGGGDVGGGGTDPGPPRAFPGAVGFGTETRGAYGAPDGQEICIVTSLADDAGDPSSDSRNGVPVYAGTFRQCLEFDLSAAHPGETWGRIILFEVSGTIVGSSPYILRVRSPFLMIAGQTAPSPGVTLRNNWLTVPYSDVVVQHLRVRVGDEVPGYDPENRDAIGICSQQRDVARVVIDHCSASWGIDETVTLGSWTEGVGCSDITVSNTIVSEGLSMSLHPDTVSDDVSHSKGLMAGRRSENISFIANLIAHNVDRNPIMQGRSGVAVNNVSYNTREWAATMTPSQTPGDLSFVGNVARKGPDSLGQPNDYALTLPGPGQGWIDNPWTFAAESKLFVEDNICHSCDATYAAPCAVHTDAVYDATSPSWNGYFQEFPSLLQTAWPLWPDGLVALPAATTESAVLAFAGARPADRDAVDDRVVADVTAGTGRIINCVELDGNNAHCDQAHEVAGGWPALAEHQRNVATEMPAAIGPLPADPHGDSNDDGYTNLENWLHCLACSVEGRSCSGC